MNYIWGESKALKNKNGLSVTFKMNLRGEQEDWIDQYKNLERRRTSFYAGKEVKLYHEYLSFSPKSSPYLTPEILKDIMKKYMEMRCDTPVLACGAVHFDEKNIHCHICISGIDLYGKSIRVTKEHLERQIQQRMEAYQMENYPQLKDSYIGYGQKRLKTKAKSHNEHQLAKRTKKPSEKELLAQKVQSIFIRSSSLNEFESNLKEEDISTYYHNGRLTGVYYKKLKWKLERTLGIDFSRLLVVGFRQERLLRIKELRRIEETRSHKNQR